MNSQLNENNIIIRKMKESDCKIISDAIQSQGWNKPIYLYEEYYSDQESGKRDMFIAEYNNKFAGYVTIQWESPDNYFRERNIPEIKDLNTLIKFRNKGTGTALLDSAEARIKEKGYKTIGLGVGLYNNYGIAQRMYVKRGYNFDGRGMLRNGEVVKPGQDVFVDDSITLNMMKEIKH